VPPRPEPSGPDRSADRARRLALASLFVVWLAFDYPIVAGRVLFPVDIARSQPPASLYRPAPEPNNPLGSDAFELYYPWRSYLGQRLASGDMPLWDPHRFAGTPFAADTQMAVWYPPNWLYAFGGTLAVTTILAVVSRLAALLLAYWFFRVIRLHPYAAALGAIVFVFCGFQIAWGVHPTFLGSSMWLPLALGGLEVAFRGRPRRGVPLAALGLALSVLAGHAQVALYVWLAAGLWAVVSGLAVTRERSRAEGGLRRPLGRVAIIAGAAFTLGAGLASIQILSTSELSPHIVRGREPYGQLVASALPARHLAGFVLPDRFGDPTDDNYVGDHNYTETAAYAGVFTLALGLAGIVLRRDRRVLAFGVIGALGFVSALGTPFYRLLYATVPGIAQTRAIGRIVFLVDVALGGLAAIGADAILRDRGRRASVVGWSALAVAAAVLAAALLVDTGALPSAAYLAPRVAAAVLVLALGTGLAVAISGAPRRDPFGLGLVALVAADLWAFGFGYFTFQRPGPVFPEPPEVRALQQLPGVRPRIASVGAPVLPANAALVHGLYDVGGSDTFILRRTVELLGLAQDQLEWARERNRIAPFAPAAAASPVLDLLGVEATVRPSGSAETEESTTYEGRFAIVEEDALPASFVACWEVVPGGSVLERLGEMEPDQLRSVALVEASSEARALGNPGSCRSGGTAILERYEAERITIRASARSRSVLVLTDAWYPGWEATVDGRPAPVLLVDHALRGVPLGPGTHRVELAYRPGWVVPAAAVTLLSAAAAGGYALRADRRLRRGPRLPA
jgi:hypothetical protein